MSKLNSIFGGKKDGGSVASELKSDVPVQHIPPVGQQSSDKALSAVNGSGGARAPQSNSKPKDNPFASLSSALAGVKPQPVAAGEGGKLGNVQVKNTNVSHATALAGLAARVLPVDEVVAAQSSSGPGITAEDFNHEGQPEKLEEKALKEFREALEVVTHAFENPSLLASAIANTVEHLRAHPFLRENIEVSDMRLMTRALRQSYGVVSLAKKETSDKKKTAAEFKDKTKSEIASMMGDWSL